MAEENDPEIIVSKLSCTFHEGELKVEINIFRIVDSDWTLEVVDVEGTSIVWNEEFKTDEAAWKAFEDDVKELGLTGLLAADEITLH